MCSAGRPKGRAVRENERMDAKTRRTLGRWAWQGSGSGRAGCCRGRPLSSDFPFHHRSLIHRTSRLCPVYPGTPPPILQLNTCTLFPASHLRKDSRSSCAAASGEQQKCATTLANGTQPSSSGGRSIGGKPTQASTRRFPPFTPALHHTSSKQTPLCATHTSSRA